MNNAAKDALNNAGSFTGFVIARIEEIHPAGDDIYVVRLGNGDAGRWTYFYLDVMEAHGITPIMLLTMIGRTVAVKLGTRVPDSLPDIASFRVARRRREARLHMTGGKQKGAM